MKIFQWNIGNSFWLTLAQSAGDARDVLVFHLQQNRYQMTVSEAAGVAARLAGPPDFIGEHEYPIVLTVPVPVSRG